ncbi:hypothetical protein TrRE_jg9107 [Triparma retinervis]|uniref:C-type lectin domain-containing protein n=1 Tax=Triparma retinervis TaxID=2557542 RepID=A0A9W7EA25_9STRA|nr:hypothetical protein TrRE_jg9107 [Triparma retinervis]
MRCFSGRKGHLVAINSPEEMAFVQSVVANQTSYVNDAHMNTWIGGVAEHNSEFVWDGFCGDPVRLDGGYTNWCEGEPNSSNGNSEHCVASHIHGTGCWYDFSCYNKANFFVVEYN